MIDWNDPYYHKCEYCRFSGPTTSKNTGDGPVYKCWCRHPDVPNVLHDYYGKACSKWERTLRFDKSEETR